MKSKAISNHSLDTYRGKRYTPDSAHSQCSIRHGLFATPIVLATIFAIAMSSIHPSVADAHALYSCGNATTAPHCYAIATTTDSQVNDSAGFQGSSTRIYAVHLQCGQCGGVNTTTGFIDDEMWLVDTYNSAWVEAGYTTVSNPISTSQDYFWADWRPQDNNVNEHILNSVPKGDYGQNPNFSIQRASTNSFKVVITSPNYSDTAYSTDNYMAPNEIQLGQELAGNAGASAPQARFSYRYYLDYAYASHGIYGNYAYQSSNPPYLGFVSGDTDFYTYCC